jgi:Zn-dependent peptidase ImmA (M78 family)
MRLLLRNLEKYGIGVEPKNEDDFYTICEAENIKVITSDENFAFSFSMMGRRFIVLPKRRRGLRKLFSMWHELAHLLAHAGDEPCVMWQGLYCDKDEAEADAIALIALIPKSHLKEMAFFDNSRYGTHLYNERIRLYFLYGI